MVVCRYVPAGDAAVQPGRLGGVVPAAGAQRTPPGDRQPGGEGDPQLRAGGEGGPGRAGAAGGLDLAVPDPAGGRGRGARRRGGDPGLPPVGWDVDAGPDLGTARDRRGDPPGGDRSAAGRRGRRTGGVRPRRAAGAGTGEQARRHQVGRAAGRHRGLRGFHRRRRVRGDGLPARRAGRHRRGGLHLRRSPPQS